MSRSSDITLAFLVGAAAGGVVALLLAPQAGSETRRQLRTGIDDLSQKGSEYLHAAERGLSDLSEATRSRVQRVADAGRRQADALKDAANAARDAYRGNKGAES